MTNKKTRWLIFIGIAALALAIRLPRLAERPMHTDEAVNAYITGNLLAGEPFRYDSQDKHGPLFFLFAKPIAQLGGAKSFSELTESGLRLTPVIIGCLTILLFGAAVEMFGFIPCLVAALLFAVAPLPVYYSRYFIHETLFVATTFALLLCAWRIGTPIFRSASSESDPKLAGPETGAPWLAALTGLCAALLLACKETAVIHFFALAATAFCLWFLNRRNAGAPNSSSARSGSHQRADFEMGAPTAKTVVAAGVVFFVACILLFTWFGKNWAALSELVHAVSRFTARAHGEGHEKPFGYYFSLLDFTFVLYLLALAGIYAVICEAVAGQGRARMALTIYGFAILLIYSAIPYKQPWLALNLFLPFALLCGFGVDAILSEMKTANGRWLVLTSGIVLLAALGIETKSLVFLKPADEKNPFAYAHTSEDLLGLPEKIQSLCDDRKIALPKISVVAQDAWPLPWYLRKFSKTGFWQPGQNVGDADFYITIGAVPANLTSRLDTFRPDFFGVRPNVLVILWTPPR